MAADTGGGAAAGGAAEDTLESLLREAEALKQRLEEERQKLNDVTRQYTAHKHLRHILVLCYQFFSSIEWFAILMLKNELLKWSKPLVVLPVLLSIF